jgi:hypothetical protein
MNDYLENMCMLDSSRPCKVDLNLSRMVCFELGQSEEDNLGDLGRVFTKCPSLICSLVYLPSCAFFDMVDNSLIA